MLAAKNTLLSIGTDVVKQIWWYRTHSKLILQYIHQNLNPSDELVLFSVCDGLQLLLCSQDWASAQLWWLPVIPIVHLQLLFLRWNIIPWLLGFWPKRKWQLLYASNFTLSVYYSNYYLLLNLIAAFFSRRSIFLYFLFD